MDIGIMVFDDAEELDFAGPLEVFGIAARLTGGITVCTVSKAGTMVRCRYGLRVTPDYGFGSCPPLDLLVIPGGKGAREQASKDDATLAFIRRHASRARVMSVCTGALVLAAAGLLDGREATTHWSAIDLLRSTPSVRVVEGARFIYADDVATSAGVSAGIDLALEVVRRQFGKDIAKQVARMMEYIGPQAADARSSAG